MDSVAVKFDGLTEQQVRLLKRSFRLMDPHKVTTRFYSKLFEQHPEIKTLFSDTNELMEKLMSVLELVVFSFDEKTNGMFGLEDSLIVPLRHLGKKHEDKGVRPEHYPIANSLLLQSIEEELGTKQFAEVKGVWQNALEHLTAAMLNTSVDSSLNSRLPEVSFFKHIIDGLKRKGKLSD